MKFLSGGVPFSSLKRDSVSGLMRLAEMGLDGMELEFVRGVKMGQEKALELARVSSSLRLVLTCHAPYYVNLNSKEGVKIEASVGRILESVKVADWAGAKRVTFHPAFYHDDDGEVVFGRVKKECEKMMGVIAENEWKVRLSPETTGKASQFGSVEELVRLAKEVPGMGLCLDLAHVCARTNGRMNGEKATLNILEMVENGLGKGALKEIYVHMSGIFWGEKGEKNHLMMEDEGNKFDWKGALRAMKKRECEGLVICESPEPEMDALLMKEFWEDLEV